MYECQISISKFIYYYLLVIYNYTAKADTSCKYNSFVNVDSQRSAKC